ncbi:MAG: primosomal protein N' [Deltaproteobacteria bacterium]|nr:primosomal protein N' [Deltaproteobacteria bacterium]
MTARFARVAIPRPVDKTFHYRIPDQLVDRIAPGTVVLAPFGKKTMTCVVVELVDDSPVKTRSLLAMAGTPSLDPGLLELAQWTAGYYRSPLGLILRMLLPPLERRNRGAKFRLTPLGKKAHECHEKGPFGEIMDLLSRGPRTSTYLEGKTDTERLDDAVETGLIEIVLPSTTGPSGGAPASMRIRDEKKILKLTPHQSSALETIIESTDKAEFTVILLHGITGSGKTEVYLRAARRMLDSGKGVLLLVPEIALTPLLTSRLDTMAPGKVAVFHSGVPAGERRAAWEALALGRARLAVGVRSGVFAPVPDLGLIIVDEEHDSSYRQEEAPSYNARDVAVKRGQIENIPVVLGSATPSLESYRNAETGRYRLAILPERATPSQYPGIEVVDMADPKVDRSVHPFLSAKLLSNLQDTVERGEQSIIFLNRRGFAPFLLCPECNYTLACPNCSVTLTYHLSRGMLCHYCGHVQPPPSICPSCGGSRIAPVGTGTQRIEEVLQAVLPGAVVERLDRDIMEKRGALENVFRRMDRGEIQVLVGTQILAKGHDFPGITLVGILNAEQALDFPDFRAAERTFQLITQVSGRSGRGSTRGRVIVQSYFPEHYAVVAALSQDYGVFYKTETAIRKEFGYPPFKRLGRVIADGISEKRVMAAIRELVGRIPRSAGIRILGPSPAPLPKIRNRHRWHFLLLADSHRDLSAALENTGAFHLPGIRVHVRVDPYNMM